MAQVGIALIIAVPFIFLFQVFRKMHWDRKGDWTATVKSFSNENKFNVCKLYVEDEKRQNTYEVKTHRWLKVGDVVDIKWDNISEEIMIKDDADQIVSKEVFKKYLVLWLSGWGILLLSISLLALLGKFAA